MNATNPACNCTNCPGASCACGCNGILAAMPAPCNCELRCGCEGADAGCLCR